MKKILCLLAGTILLGCAPTTRITGSWKNTTLVPKYYRNIFVAGITGNTVARSVTESDISQALGSIGISSIKSMDVLPPTIASDSSSMESLMKAVKQKGSDGILTISLLKKSTESRYEPGGYPYAPASRWMYYGSFYGYYNYWYPYAYSPGYYDSEDVYYIETNLYDAASENLMWSAQSQTYSYNGLAPVSKEFAEIIVNKLVVDGMLEGRKKNR